MKICGMKNKDFCAKTILKHLFLKYHWQRMFDPVIGE